MENLEMVLCCT